MPFKPKIAEELAAQVQAQVKQRQAETAPEIKPPPERRLRRRTPEQAASDAVDGKRRTILIAVAALVIPLVLGLFLRYASQRRARMDPPASVAGAPKPAAPAPVATGMSTSDRPKTSAPPPVLVAPTGALLVHMDQKAVDEVLGNPSLQEGLNRLSLGDDAGAVKLFEKAVQVDPNSASAYRGLATAELRLGKAAEGWKNVRKAYKLNPSDRLIGELYSGAWQAVAQTGATDVGTPAAQARKALGEPDAVVPLGLMAEQWIYGPLALSVLEQRVFATLDLASLGAPPTVNLVHINRMMLDVHPWRPGPRVCLRQYEVLEYIYPGEFKNNWTRMLTVQRLPNARARAREKLGPVAALSARSAAHELMRAVEQTYLGATWSILRDGEDDLVFEWKMPASKGAPAQVEVVRMVAHGDDLHRVAATVKATDISPALRNLFVEIVESAKLSSTGKQPR